MLSVALCTYNGEKYIEEQLNSILKQTLPVDEIVICDDGSTDRTLQIIASLNNDTNPTIHVHHNETNIGPIRNFLKAINLCSGDIIFLSDQDDIWFPNKVETIYNYFKSHIQTDALFTDAILIDSNGRLFNDNYTLWSYYFDDISRKRCEIGLMIEEFCTTAHATGATMAFRKQLTKRFPQRYDIWHDEMIARLAVSSHSLAYLPECLIRYRIHNNQQIGISSYKPNEKFCRDYRTPQKPFPNEDTLLTNEKDIKHINFLRFRYGLKGQTIGFANAVLHIFYYIKFYHTRAFAFVIYDVRSSIRHTGKRIISKFKKTIRNYTLK